MSENTNAPTAEVGAFDETTTPSMPPFLTYAEEFIDRGWHIHPLRRMGKEPLIKAWQINASCDKIQIRKWMSQYPNANIGIATELSGLVVVDLDYPKDKNPRPKEWALDGVTDGADVFAVVAERYGASFPTNTFTVKTPNGGLHLYFKDNLKPVSSGAGVNGMWLVDVRSKGGYVVAPGSVLATGIYQNGVIDEVVDCPEWIREAIKPSMAVTPQPNPTVATYQGSTFSSLKSKSDNYFRVALENILREVLEAREGTRNHTLNRAAFALGKLAKENPNIYIQGRDSLLTCASHIGLSNKESTQTIESGLVAGLTATGAQNG